MGIVSIGQALTQLPAHQQPACSEKNNNNSQRSFQDTGNNKEQFQNCQKKETRIRYTFLLKTTKKLDKIHKIIISRHRVSGNKGQILEK